MGGYQQALDPDNQKPSCSKNHGYFLSKPFFVWLTCGFLSLAVLHLFCCVPTGNGRATFSPLMQYLNNTYSFVSEVYASRRKEL
uniref:Uncharacterized protein n=1 Tax=Leersia perrieri TaxID=77586 RepID=A0A0D9WXD2_9ORYZ